MFDDLKFLAWVPFWQAKRFNAYNDNGFKFCTIDQEEGLRMQNNRIFTIAKLEYYGKLIDIIKLNYHGWFNVVLFQCKWVNANRGVRKDPLQFTPINFSRLIHIGENDPCILASQAHLVYYVDDGNGTWLECHCPLETKGFVWYKGGNWRNILWS